MADQNYNRPYRTNDPNRRPNTPAPNSAPANDPLAELARLIGQNDPFAEFNPAGSRPHEDSQAPDGSPADWQHSRDPAHDDFFRNPAAHSSYSDDHDAEDHGSRERPGTPSNRYLGGQGYYDRNTGHPDRNAGYADRDQNYSDAQDPQRGADGYSSYDQPDQPEHEQPSYGAPRYDRPTYDPPGHDQSSYDRGGSDPAGYARGRVQDDPGLPPNALNSERQNYPRPDAYVQQESRPRDDPYAQGYPQNDGYSEHDSYPEGDTHGSDDHYDDPGQPPRRGGLLTVVAVLGLAIVGTAGAFTYRATFGKPGSSAPVVIKRDPGTIKMPIAQSDTQSSRSALERVERIVPHEEQPVDVQQTIVADSPPTMLPGLVPNVRPATPSAPPPSVAFASPPPAAGAPTASATSAAPKRIHTVPIKPSDADASAASANPPPAATNRVAPSKPLAPTPNAPLSLASVAQTHAAVAVNPPVTHVASASGSVGADGGYLVQVSSQRSESDAQASFRSLKAKYSELIGDREPVIRRADLGDKGIYYRAMVGGFATAQEAGQFCDSLKAAGGACLIQRN
jgi:hypothetical protein